MMGNPDYTQHFVIGKNTCSFLHILFTFEKKLYVELDQEKKT